MQILYIEDDPVDRMAFERMVELEKAPFTYAIAETVREGLEFIEKGRYDLILADLRLPDGTAFDIINRIEPDEGKIVVLTAIDSVETAVLAMKKGACDYIIKDLDRAYLSYLPDVIRSFEEKPQVLHRQNPDITSFLQKFLEITPIPSLITEVPSGRIISINQPFFDLWDIPPCDQQEYDETDGAWLLDQVVTRLLFEQDAHFLKKLRSREMIDTLLPTGDGRTIRLFSQLLPAGEDETPLRLICFEEQRAGRNTGKQVPRDDDGLAVLAGGIAHEFNNILSVILLCISNIRSDLTPEMTSDMARILCRINQTEEAVFKGKQLTSRLLTYARGGEPVLTRYSLVPLFREKLGISPEHEKIVTVIKYPDDLYDISADSEMISLALSAILQNAIEAAGSAGTVSIVAENTREMVRITITDNGAGIPDSEREKVFSPFYSTKDGHIGIGLSSARSIISRHNGGVVIHSTPGTGTQVLISLPSSTSPENYTPYGDRLHTEEPTGKKLKILVLDDEILITEIMAIALRARGHEVVCTYHTNDAICEFYVARQSDHPFDLVILDLIIPGESGGIDVINQIREVDQEVTAIVCSGYCSEPAMAKYTDYGFDYPLPKPFRVKDLVELIESLQITVR